MMKWIDPIVTRFKLVPRPHMFMVHDRAPVDPGKPTTGQRLAELVAAFVGSWWFLGGQAGFLFLWLIYNTIQITTHFDPPPYILLNLLLSFQAAFTGPVLLIAANVGAVRDHRQSNRIEALAEQSAELAKQNEQLAKQNAELVAAMMAMERKLDEHVVSNLREHAIQLVELGTLLRAVHASVCAEPAAVSGGAESTDGARPDLANVTAPDVPQAHAESRTTPKQRGSRRS